MLLRHPLEGLRGGLEGGGNGLAGGLHHQEVGLVAGGQGEALNVLTQEILTTQQHSYSSYCTVG